ncbi:MAG: TonB-dependent receptor [Verrucomicrobia bacterium]|nr:TonB-dependent receptor [Verrucomicrobiota bacterium]
MNTFSAFHPFNFRISSFVSVWFLFLGLNLVSSAQQIASPTPSPSPTAEQPSQSAEQLNPVTVIGELNEARYQIVPDLGATKYSIGQTQIQSMSQGDNAPFNQVILRAPGVAQDSFGQLHVRDEHANLQYRINDVLIPEGIAGFGQEIDTRLVQNVALITGSLPAQFGFFTTGIIDIQTKEGPDLNGSQVSIYGGSHNTINPSFESGGSYGKFNYFVLGSYDSNDLGIENTTGSPYAIHDRTDQYKLFAYLDYIIDDSSRISLLLSGTYSDFQIPNNPNQPPVFTLANAAPDKNFSVNLNENQHEQNHYAVLAYQKTIGDLTFQLAAFSRFSQTLFTPDDQGDLIFNGIASRVNDNIFSNGVQFDAAWQLNDYHTLRGGFLVSVEKAIGDSNNLVFPGGPGFQTSTVPVDITDDTSKTGLYYGFYLQDEWQVFAPLTINFGGRFDVVDEYAHANQVSPRVNTVLKATRSLTLHAGYAKYFTPPPLELVNNRDLAKFIGTTNQAAVNLSSPVQPERADYFDAGLIEQFTSAFSMGVDTYYKEAHDLLDLGQFGAALIFAPFNYVQGNQYGTEVIANYSEKGFNAYLNFGFERGTGKTIGSGQFQFTPEEIAFIQNHWVFLDHDQRYTASAGVSYTFMNTTVYGDMLYGDGLRSGFANTEQVPAYWVFNLGISHTFKLPEYGRIQVRFDITNIFNNAYELRTGSGIGVFAPQFGPRRGFFGGVSWLF